jgi:NAD(P)-dependent dehydrogenase (short-subunit alcohol dehydrogenase family)
MADGLAGKRVVVTGSSQGIGREVALRLAAEGASVVVNGSGSTPGALEGVVSEILAAGGRAVACPGSVAEPETAERLVDACVRSFGGLDVLINVAGVAEPPRSSILNIGLEDWRRQIDVHLNGTFYACRAAARLMAGQRSGVIINTSSHGFQGIYGGTGYAAAKGATNSLTYALAKDLAEHGVRVNAVCPGARTRLSTGPEYEESIRTLHARGLLDDAMMKASLNPAGPEFVAALYAYLASDLADGITGKLFSGAGGYVGLFDGPSERPLAFRKVSAGEGWSLDELHAALAKALRPAEAGQSAA